MNRIGRGEAVIHTIEYVLFIPLVMEDAELRRIEEASRVQSVHLEEIAPVLCPRKTCQSLPIAEPKEP